MFPRYQQPVYRPPSEAGSLLIQATYGCPHNKCAFCGMYKDTQFRARPMAEVLEDIDGAAKLYGGYPGIGSGIGNGPGGKSGAGTGIGGRVRTIFLPDGNTIALSTGKLLTILERIAERFPGLERVTTYGGAKFVIRKSLEELKRLRQAGLSRLHMGMESGDPVTLELINKGTTPEQIIEAGQLVRQAGIELSEYYLVGLGGIERWEAHARESARVLSAIQPDFVRLRTLVPIPTTPLGKMMASGEFVLPGPRQSLEEVRLMVAGLEGQMLLLSDHVSNYLNLNGRLPDDKEPMLAMLDRALELDDAQFCEQIPWWSL